MLSFKPAFSLSSFTFIKKLFSSSSLSAIKVISPAYLMLLVFLLSILIPACDSSSPAFYMMYSACKLNNQSDNILSIVCRYIYLSKYIIDGVSESNVSRNEQLLAFSGECMDLYYVTFCIVLYASLFYFIFFIQPCLKLAHMLYSTHNEHSFSTVLLLRPPRPGFRSWERELEGLYASLKDSLLFFFLMKGFRYLEIRVNGDKWLHQSSERMICWDGIRREAESWVQGL